ncbi:hypothetical protein ACFL07_03055 [Pseudomonadota bacterium]
MNVLKSYAHQVVSYHPEKARDDLFAEIYDELCEEFKDWQEMNPGKSEADFLDETKEHPMKYATRLAAEGSAYLIGPQLYFSFISALKIGATLTGLFYLAMAAIYASASGLHLGTFIRVLSGFPLSLLWVSAAILGVFVALEKSGERASWLDKWSAADLEDIDDNKPMSRGNTLFDLGIAVLALLWLVDIIQVPAFIDLANDSVSYWLIDLPDWFWIAVGIMLVFDIAHALFRLTRNFWSPRLRLTTIASNLVWIALLGFAIVQPELLDIQGEPANLSQDLLQMAEKAIRGVLGFVCALLAWDTVIHVWRLWR